MGKARLPRRLPLHGSRTTFGHAEGHAPAAAVRTAHLAVATALSAGARRRLSAAESLADWSHLTAAGHPTARNYPTAAEAAHTTAGRPVARQAQLATAEYAGPWNH